MTKEEYLSIVDKEVDRLKEEKQKLEKRIRFLEFLDGNESKELKEAGYQLDVVLKKLDGLAKFIKVESRIRIEAMSEVELNQYRDKLADDSKKTVNALNEEIENAQKTIAELKESLEALVNGGDLSEQALSQARNLKINIKLKEDNLEGVIKHREREEQEIERINQMSPDKVRETLLKEIPNTFDINRFIEYNEENNLDAVIGSDYDKAKKLAQLRRNINALIADYNNLRIHKNYFISDLPCRAAYMIRLEYHEKDGKSPITVDYPERLMRVVQEAINAFQKQKEKYESIYTLDNLLPLIGKNQVGNIDTYNIDMDYLVKKCNNEQYEEELRILQDHIAERDKLEKKIIKTRQTKDEITNHNMEISGILQDLYTVLYKDNVHAMEINFYQTGQEISINNSTELTSDDMSSEQKLRERLDKIKKGIEKAEKNLNGFRDLVQRNLDEYNRIREIKLEERKKAEKELEELTGKKALEYPSTENGIARVASDVSVSYQTNLLKQIKEEAQKQADAKEAEIRKISLEELYNLRKQVIEQNNEQEVTEEDNHTK